MMAYPCGELCRKADRATREGQSAEGWIGGVTRGGHVMDGEFYYYGPGPLSVPVEAVRDLEVREDAPVVKEGQQELEL